MKKALSMLCALLVFVFALTGCGTEQTNGKTLKVGATPVPHAEILEVVKPLLAKEGINLEIVEFNDYVQPNLALNDKELDANYMQHQPYLDDLTAEHQELKLVGIAGIHIEPMGVYSKKIRDLQELKDGATISIPNDPTNGGRALLLLEKAGLLKLKEDVREKATVRDIAENPKHISFKEVEPAQVPRTLEDVDVAVINTNYAMQVDLVPVKDALFIESGDSPYVNIIAVRAGDEHRPEIEALVKAVKSAEVKKFIDEKYQGAVVPAF